jgi:uncharacterized protein (TIGR02231 family)
MIVTATSAIFALFVTAAPTVAALAAEAAPPAPAIVEVVVYPDRAAVTRRTSVACRDRAWASFAHIPPGADAGSFRAQARGGDVLAVRARETARAAAYSPRVAAIDQQLGRLAGEITEIEAALARARAQAENGEAYRGITEELVTRELTAARPNVGAWRRALRTVLDTGLAAARARTPLDARLRQLRRERERLTAERGLLGQAAARSDHLVEVEVSCASPGEVTVSLGYTVAGASWSSAYEARSERDDRHLELAVYATVEQATGEDWRGARLVLSTARPGRHATPPRIEPLAVFADPREAPRPRAVAWTEVVRHAEAARPRAGAETSTAVRASRQGASVQMALLGAADVPGDGTPVRLLVARHRLASRLRLQAAPRLAPAVFRLAEAFNGAPFALQPGPVDVYRAGGFVSRHLLDETPPGGRFTVSLGVDERLRVSRLILEERQQKAGLFGRSRHQRFHYRLTIASHLSAPEEVELVDQIPVSELDDLPVVLERATTPGYTLDRRDGIVSWRWRLAPGERRAAELAFRIEVPPSYR